MRLVWGGGSGVGCVGVWVCAVRQGSSVLGVDGRG